MKEINLSKEWKKIEEQANINLKDWRKLEDLIWKMQLKIEELKKSRENWKSKYFKLKNRNKKK